MAPVDGYLPIEDFGLVGDGSTAALVGRDGAVSWLCVPRFDDEPLFCSILDAHRGGRFRLAPAETVAARQRYEPDSGVLTTELRSPSGLIRITACLTLRAGADLTEDVPAGRGELLRSVVVLEGRVRLEAEISLRGGATAEPLSEGLCLKSLRQPELDLQLSATVPLEGLETMVEVEAGDRVDFLLRWGGGSHHRRSPSMAALLQSTLDAWRRWVRNLSYDGPQQALVRRSAITLKMLDYMDTGGLVAAPTSSLPESLAASATVTTATPGCETSPLRCTPCAASAYKPRPGGSWDGFSTP